MFEPLHFVLLDEECTEHLASSVTIVVNFVNENTDETVEEFIKSVNMHYPNMRIILGVSDSMSSISTEIYRNSQLKTFSTP